MQTSKENKKLAIISPTVTDYIIKQKNKAWLKQTSIYSVKLSAEIKMDTYSLVFKTAYNCLLNTVATKIQKWSSQITECFLAAAAL